MLGVGQGCDLHTMVREDQKAVRIEPSTWDESAPNRGHPIQGLQGGQAWHGQASDPMAALEEVRGTVGRDETSFRRSRGTIVRNVACIGNEMGASDRFKQRTYDLIYT